MEDVLDPKDKLKQEQSGRSRLNVYEQTPRWVQRTAGRSAMRTLAAYINGEIRGRETLPTGEDTREEGGRILRDFDYDIEDDSWFNP